MYFEFESKGYNLTLYKDDNYDGASNRVLIVLGTVPSDMIESATIDLKVLRHCIKYAIETSAKYGARKHSFAVVNFNDYPHLKLSGTKRAEALSWFTERLNKIIEHTKPTKILFSGDASSLINYRKESNGCFFDYKGIPLVPTLDFERLLSKNGEYANLLGFWTRHLAYLLAGKHPFSLRHVTPADMSCVFVDTIAKFDRVMALWDHSKVVALDTETQNLSSLQNKVLTIQLCFEGNKNRGFLIPLHHTHDANPFTTKQKAYIEEQLRKRLARSDKELVTFNGAFDLRVLRRQLSLPIIGHTVWEIQAGEHLLDENISSLASISHPAGGLAAVLSSYDNDSYLSGGMSFSKGERHNVAAVSPKDKGFLTYGCLDVVSIMNIRDMQIKRAGFERLLSTPYTEYFCAHMRYMMSDTVHQLSHMKDAGSLIDRKYLKSLMSPSSDLNKLITELEQKICNTSAGKEASRRIGVSTQKTSKSLFGGVAVNNLKLSKPAHRNILMLDVLGLSPVNYTANGTPSVDSDFISKYKSHNPVVALYADYQAATKIMSTYVVGWEKTFMASLDGADSHLRADFSFFGVDTGRLASSKPNFQNIPSRGKLAKIIKRMFIAADGTLLIAFDFSAHEVRGWSQASGDMQLAEVFRAGQKLRQRLLKASSAGADVADILSELKTRGDVHIQNVKRFFGRWVEKSDPLRDAVKAVVFGTLYGKSAKSLGDDTKKSEFDSIKQQLAEAKDHKEIERLEQAFADLVEEDRSESAQEIIDKMFAEFQAGHRWVQRMQKSAKERFYVYSPVGRIRHLYAAMTQDHSIVSRQVRRGLNAPIQGFASELAVKASRLTLLAAHDYANRFGIDMSKFRFSRMVHDASYYTVPYEMVLPFLHILQYETTYGVSEAIEEQFGFKLTIEPEIEMDIGTNDTNAQTWDWQLSTLLPLIERVVDEGLKDGVLTDSKDYIMAKIKAPWLNGEQRAHLNAEYPMLGVKLHSKYFQKAAT